MDLSPAIEVCPTQLPGHEDRLRETPVATIEEAAELVLHELRHELDLPFAFFGHSMGALVSYQVALLLLRAGLSTPQYLFVSGYAAPHLEHIYAGYDALPDEELLRALIDLGGVPPKLLRHPEIFKAVLPIVRADLACCARYHALPGASRLTCPIIGFCGTSDPLIAIREMRGWGEHTRGSFGLHGMPGGHFFHKSNLPSVLSQIRSTLLEARPARAVAAVSSSQGEDFPQ